MNQATTKQYDEFIFRRTVEPISLFGFDIPGMFWIFLLILVMLVGIIYVGIMYFRDSRGVGIIWGLLLGMLRLGVYAVIAFIFLLPSRQSWEESSSSSKVVVLFDTSMSMGTRDDLPMEGQAWDKLPTRQDKVLRVLENSEVNFFGRLEKKNPVTVYRIGRGLDADFVHLADGRAWTKDERTDLEEKMKAGLPLDALPTTGPLPGEYFRSFIQPERTLNAKNNEPPDELNTDDKKRYTALAERNKSMHEGGFFTNTNVGDAVIAALTRESKNMLQGIVIFTDGRSTEGSDGVYDAIRDRAAAANPPVPIFVVAIGEERPQVRIEIAGLRAPQQVQPEDTFRIVMEVTGEGLGDQEFDAGVDLRYVVKKEGDKEEELEIYIIEQEDKKDPKKERVRIDLGKKIVLLPEKKPKFDRSNPPRVEIEYTIDALKLAAAAKVDLAGDPKLRGKKWEIGETKDGEFRLQARVPKDKLEIFPHPEHKSDVVNLSVSKRPIRVLLFASAATHDFQFLNNMLIREVEQNRAELSVYVQPPPGKDAVEWLKSVVLGVKADRLLAKFPDRLDQPSDTPAEKVYDLSEYDVIVAFDPDWSKLTNEQLKLVNKWCEKGGGIVLLGGPINTLQLARPGEHREKLKPVLDLLPVVLKDVRIEALDRTTDSPWPLNFPGATPEMEFLKLAEETDKGPPPFLDDWKEFFYGKDGKGIIKRGFFNYYPSDMVKTGAITVATFMDPRAKMKNGDPMPYIVLSDPAGGTKVVWIAWGETRRLRQHSEMFHERFWTKLVRYAGSGNQTNLNKRVQINMDRTFTSGRFVQMDARIDDKGGVPYIARRDEQKPYIMLKLPAGVVDPQLKPEKDDKEGRIKYVLDPKKSKDEGDLGKFNLRFQVKAPGEYQLELKVPETGDSVFQKFLVKESNPELDVTQPDFDAMYKLASDADLVFARMSPTDQQELQRRLVRPKLEKKDDKSGPAVNNKVKLYFDLRNAELIPNCMVTETKEQRNKGPYKDVWDGGWDIFGIFEFLHIPVWMRNGLVAIVGLLSMEWLLRKLLRLA